MKKFAALGLSAAVVLSLAIAPSAQAKVKVTKPAAPTVASIFSSPVKKGKVNITFAITLPTNTGGAKITGSKVRAGGKSCTIKRTKTSCTIKGITNGKALNVIAQTKNKKGFGARSVGIRYVAGAGAFSAAVIPAAPVVPVTPVVTVPAPNPPAPTPSATPFITSWGWNFDGQLGNASTTNSNVPVALSTTGVLTGKTITATSAGGLHTCALTSDATNNAYCWGWNFDGQLGNALTTDSNIPVAVSTVGVLSGKTITAISAGYYHTCAITSEATNNAYCWGWNAVGQLGNALTTGSNTPVAVGVSSGGALIGKTITAISAGFRHTCAITSDVTNNAYCWGFNFDGQLGDNSTTQRNSPVAVSTVGVLSGKTITVISAGNDHTCAITSDVTNNAYCWGWNSGGQLGNASTTNSNTPVAVGVSSGGALSNKKITAISAGGFHTCAITSEATNNAYCWGFNGEGQLGNASTTGSNIPVAVSTVGVLSGKTTTAISAGNEHTSAIAN